MLLFIFFNQTINSTVCSVECLEILNINLVEVLKSNFQVFKHLNPLKCDLNL